MKAQSSEQLDIGLRGNLLLLLLLLIVVSSEVHLLEFVIISLSSGKDMSFSDLMVHPVFCKSVSPSVLSLQLKQCNVVK